MLLILVALGLWACNKDEEQFIDPPTLGSTDLVFEPEGEATYDASSAGLYKGVFLGSSGTLRIEIANDATSPIYQARLETDDSSVTVLTSTDFDTYTPGDAINAAVFVSGDDSLLFTVNGDGTSPVVVLYLSASIEDSAIVRKEPSTQLVQCFLGEYVEVGVDTGTVAFLMTTDILGLVRTDDALLANSLTGTYSGVQTTGLSVTGSSNTVAWTSFTGTIQNVVGSGTWSRGASSGTWSVVRRL